jgi:hypothetical protein
MPEAVKKSFMRVVEQMKLGDSGDKRIVGEEGARAQDGALSAVREL